MSDPALQNQGSPVPQPEDSAETNRQPAEAKSQSSRWFRVFIFTVFGGLLVSLPFAVAKGRYRVSTHSLAFKHAHELSVLIRESATTSPKQPQHATMEAFPTGRFFGRRQSNLESCRPKRFVTLPSSDRMTNPQQHTTWIVQMVDCPNPLAPGRRRTSASTSTC